MLFHLRVNFLDDVGITPILNNLYWCVLFLFSWINRRCPSLSFNWHPLTYTLPSLHIINELSALYNRVPSQHCLNNKILHAVLVCLTQNTNYIYNLSVPSWQVYRVCCKYFVIKWPRHKKPRGIKLGTWRPRRWKIFGTRTDGSRFESTLLIGD